MPNIITPEELAEQLRVDELVDPVVEKICESLTEELYKKFTSQKLSDEAVVNITACIYINSTLPELQHLRDETDRIKKYIISICAKSQWMIANPQLIIGSKPGGEICGQITFTGAFMPTKRSSPEDS